MGFRAFVAVSATLLAVAATAADECPDLHARRDRVNRQIARLCPTPSPRPTTTPAPTAKPQSCQLIKEKDGQLAWDATFDIGQERTFCFDITSLPPSPKPGGIKPDPNIHVQSENKGNASCAKATMQAFGPSGSVTKPTNPDEGGVQPSRDIEREVGRFYVWVKLLEADPAICKTYTFTVVK